MSPIVAQLVHVTISFLRRERTLLRIIESQEELVVVNDHDDDDDVVGGGSLSKAFVGAVTSPGGPVNVAAPGLTDASRLGRLAPLGSASGPPPFDVTGGASAHRGFIAGGQLSRAPLAH